MSKDAAAGKAFGGFIRRYYTCFYGIQQLIISMRMKMLSGVLPEADINVMEKRRKSFQKMMWITLWTVWKNSLASSSPDTKKRGKNGSYPHDGYVISEILGKIY
ncbi:MAG: hypothetical protein LUC90_12420 [Lachnospiraceae bacterium]|nr:hypothetical protein [Lachnospiraceae bacterium]